MLTVWMVRVALAAFSVNAEPSVVLLPGITRDAEAVVVTVPGDLAAPARPNASRRSTTTFPAATRGRGESRLVRVTFVRPDGSVTTRLVCRTASR